MNNAQFWKQTAERAIKTFCQALIAAFGATAAVPVWQLGWQEAVGIALTATVLSVLTSVASTGAGEEGTPSLVATDEPHGIAEHTRVVPDAPEHYTQSNAEGESHRAD